MSWATQTMRLNYAYGERLSGGRIPKWMLWSRKRRSCYASGKGLALPGLLHGFIVGIVPRLYHHSDASGKPYVRRMVFAGTYSLLTNGTRVLFLMYSADNIPLCYVLKCL